MDQSVAPQSEEDLAAAVTAFYDRAVREVYRYFHRATAGDGRLTEDLTQETFLACVRAAGRGERDSLTMPWLMGVARHKLVDHYRRRRREEHKLTLAWSAAPPEAVEPDPDMTGADALRALGRLSDSHRVVLVLRYLDDLPVARVAATIGKSVRATESLIVRARRALDQIVAEGRHG